MKISFLKFSFFSLIFSVLLFSCGQKKLPVETEEKTDDDFSIEIPEEPDRIQIEEKLLPSVVLSPNAGLNLLGRDNKMHRMKSLSSGNVLSAVEAGGELQLINLFSEEENAVPETYVRAVYDNVDFWVYADYVAADAEPAIILKTGDGLKFSQIVAVSLRAQDDPEMSLIYYFDSSLDKVCSKLIPSEDVSTYADDVEMASIIQKLKTTTRATPRNELFLKAEKLNASPAMKKKLDAEKTEKLSYDYQEVLKTMPGARYIVNVEELNTVDQSKDPFSSKKN